MNNIFHYKYVHHGTRGCTDIQCQKRQFSKIHWVGWSHEYNIFKDGRKTNWMSLIVHQASHLVNLGDHSIHHFPLKWAENNGLVLYWIENKPSPWLDHTCPDVVNGGDSNHKAIPGRRNTNRWLVRPVWSSSLCQWRESLGVCSSKWLFLLFNHVLGMRHKSLAY